MTNLADTGSQSHRPAITQPCRSRTHRSLSYTLDRLAPIKIYRRYEPFKFPSLCYVLKLEKADVYRLPYLASSGPGFALLEAARKANFRDILNRITTGFSSANWSKPILLAWGASDKYLPISEAEAFQKTNPEAIQLKVIEGAGHMPQEDWPEKVVEALSRFL